MLRGELPDNRGDDVVFSEQEETRVIRTPEWVLFKRFAGSANHDLSDELYDVENRKRSDRIQQSVGQC